MVDPVVPLPTPPKTPLIVRVVDGLRRPVRDAEIEVLNFRPELKGAPTDVKRQSDANGRAEFGLVDPRIEFDIRARKATFGPTAKPFTPGDVRTSRHAPLKSVPIELVLTRNIARLSILVTDATTHLPLGGASVGVDGFTGTPAPTTSADGTVGPIEVAADTDLRMHAQHANFGPNPGGTPFNGEVAATRRLNDGDIVTQEFLLHQTPITPLVVRVTDGFGQPLPAAEVEVVGLAQKNTGANGRADFGIVESFRTFDVRARKATFGPKKSPFAVGDAGVVRQPPLAGTPIELQLTRNVARLTVLVTDATVHAPLGAANVGVDGVTGTPEPKSRPDGKFGPIEVEAGKPLRVHAQHANFGPNPGGTPFDGEVVANRILADGEDATQELVLHQAPLVSPKFDKPKLVVVVKKAHTDPARQPVTLTVDADFDGTGRLSAEGTGGVKFFDSLTAGAEVPIATDFTGAQLRAGVPLFLEGAAASGGMDSLVLKLTLSGGTKTKLGPARMTVTVVEVFLDICETRTSAAADPRQLSQADKLGKGRFIHRQKDVHHGRARLFVGAVKPGDFTGDLRLTPGLKTSTGTSGTVKLFRGTQEKPAAGQAALGNPHDFPASDVGAGLAFFAEGDSASGGLRDTGCRLGVKGVEDDGDHVAITVVEFSNLRATIPSTPPLTLRAGNAAPTHARVISGGANDHWSLDDALNSAVVLIENSLPGGKPVQLSVAVRPAGVPVVWDVPRDKHPSPHADADAVAGLSGKPSLAIGGGSPPTATLLANGVGTFHASAFVDCNGSAAFEPTIDKPPYIPMNFVLVRVETKSNDSVAQAFNCSVVPAAPTAATGIRVSTGNDPPGPLTPALCGAYSKATATLTGGGDVGRRGLDRVFSGWAQQIGPTPSSASVPPGLDIFGQYLHTLPIPAGGAPPAPTAPRRQFFIFTQSVPAGAAFAPLAALPVVEIAPVLDVTPTGADGIGGDSCTGQWGGHGVLTTPIPKVDRAVGQDWTVDTADSPAVGLGATHPFFAPTRMTAFRFNIDFRVDLLFWTNGATPPRATPTGDPADNLYSSVQTNTWTVRFSIAFDPATGAPVGAVPAVGLVLNKDGTPNRRATPVEGMGLETRAPIALRLFRRDATA